MEPLAYLRQRRDIQVFMYVYSSNKGGISCSCVQDISVISCEENIMFWEVSGIGTEVILSLVVPSESLLLSALAICLLLFI